MGQTPMKIKCNNRVDLITATICANFTVLQTLDSINSSHQPCVLENIFIPFKYKVKHIEFK